MAIVSLTSIPPRFPKLFKTLDSLKRQRLNSVEKIELWLPNRFKRFPDFEVNNLSLPDGVELRPAEVDLGPATKVLPAAMAWQDVGVNLLYCDDDKEFSPLWAAGFIKASKEYQAKGFKDFAVSAIGVCVDNFSMAKSNIVHSKRPRRQNPVLDFRYRIKKIDFWLATVLFNSKKVKPVRSRWFSTPGQIDIMEGYGGVLVRPEFFKPDDLYIPDPIWRVDDIWLSGLLAKRKIPVLANYYSRIPQAHDETIYALAEEITNGLSRQDLNQLAIKHFQKNYGVWL